MGSEGKVLPITCAACSKILTLNQKIDGHIAEFSANRFGSRFIQDKLQSASSEEKEKVFRELMDELAPLMTDVYGNYVVQKFLEHGTNEQRTCMANVMKPIMMRLSENKYGCRVVQKVSPICSSIRIIELELI